MIFKIFLLLFVFMFYSKSFANVISGNIIEKSSGEVVIGATATIYKFSESSDSSDYTLINGNKLERSPLKGAFSNQYGFYSIANVQNGKYGLVIRNIGYDIYYKEVNISDNNARIDIELTVNSVLTDEVQVYAEKDFSPTAQISSIEISPTMISKLPQFGSEVDVFRTLQLLPGVASASELSSGLYVRGGSPDQNLVLLDEVIVYNPSHMAGFLSTFNADALRDIKLIKGAMPAEYGGRLSSVIDMYMKEGTKEKVSGKGAISLISSKLTVEGPITDESTFMFSGRRFYFDLLTSLMSSGEMPQYYFYDLNGKVNVKLGENDRLYASGYFGRDVLNFDEEFSDDGIDFGWGNRTLNLRWKHIASPVLFTNFSAIYTNYNSKLKIVEDYGDSDDKEVFSTLSEIEDFTLKGKGEYFGIDDHLIKFGAEVTNHAFESGVNTSFNEDFENDLIGTRKINSMDAAVFIQDEWNINDRLSTNLGTRLYYFQQGNYLKFEPRISASYKLNDNISFIAAGAIANQFLHLIVRNDINLPTDLWFPSTDKVKPQQSSQVVVGTHTKFGSDNSWKLNIEGYYKDMQNLLEYKEDAQFTLGIPLEDQFTSGVGWAYGVEFFLEKKIGNFVGWVGYTYAKTQRKFEELNNGNVYYPRYDRRHDISIALTYEINEKWELGAAWVLATGQAYTMPTGAYQGLGVNGNNYIDENGQYWGGKYQYSDRNGQRLPNYHRLDLNLMYKYEWFGLPWVLSINTYNTYNRQNPFAWYIGNDYKYDPNTGQETNTKKLKQITLFPIIPTIGFSFEF